MLLSSSLKNLYPNPISGYSNSDKQPEPLKICCSSLINDKSISLCQPLYIGTLPSHLAQNTFSHIHPNHNPHYTLTHNPIHPSELKMTTWNGDAHQVPLHRILWRRSHRMKNSSHVTMKSVKTKSNMNMRIPHDHHHL
mmetsp:Transcript_5742/g.21758  ORF Transcript_5742/g.21758 Transcript_5742/m.21758 type:complete len:138 (-) Transcript_5742:284-697(-)